ncbi:sodium:solute symporter family protein [Paenactinomyces guangxiensis]|uniref:Na+:solute symporter n=1 Tax=Paenactinomyces guangxiensis TaxID=1490290 RepID=A0A7W1WUK4_9BACL|nr:sodium:solute symporter family protein [Paenactinomyces guangxiensis]MBA4496258.1 Na+:solute symporter [Paenactinomyces guangxiensis]MBH8593360.1 Na+:solute symporter [Paenactinomyces guangxiensis]
MLLADWIVMGLYFLLMVGIGLWSFRQIKGTQDFFAAGGKMPWWLSGISHHMSGYSAAVFVAYAGVAYQYGFTIYIWWAVPISIAVLVGAIWIAPRWARLRQRLNIESPMEYLSMRYNLPTQQLMAWSGVLLKLFDVGAKWAAIAVILNVFAGVSITAGIIISGFISLFYITIGGLWADALTDFAQFVVQLIAGVAMFVIVLAKLGGISAVTGIWDQLPPHHSSAFVGPYTIGFILAYLLIDFLSYNGGTWNLAQRFIAAPRGSDARKAAFLSAALYLIWPLVLFFPMWAAPLFYPSLADPTQSYSVMAKDLLPPGLVGLVLASMFAHTMAMTTSDANAVTSVFTRDILPVLSRKFRSLTGKASLRTARLTTVTFTVLTLIVAINADSFGGILDLLIVWFGALVGPISIPMLLGLLPAFRHSDSIAAIVSWVGGILTFAIVKYAFIAGTATTVAAPVLVSAVLFIFIGWLKRNQDVKPEVIDLIDSLNQDTDEPTNPPSAGINAG